MFLIWYVYIPAMLLAFSPWLICRWLPKKTPRDMRKRLRTTFWLELPLNYFLVFYALRKIAAGRLVTGSLLICVYVFVVGTSILSAFGRQSRKEIEDNYRLDPDHCGRCDYDLTGNTTGICPECGWRLTRSTELPPVAEQIENTPEKTG